LTIAAAAAIGFIAGVALSALLYLVVGMLAYHHEASEKVDLIYNEMKEDIADDSETIQREAKENGST
jgi:hypothetical protein|tara:strand:+ start:564 stop:764 length:201 start_codon:yes stop_codon:yes gene_type:complete